MDSDWKLQNSYFLSPVRLGEQAYACHRRSQLGEMKIGGSRTGKTTEAQTSGTHDRGVASYEYSHSHSIVGNHQLPSLSPLISACASLPLLTPPSYSLRYSGPRSLFYDTPQLLLSGNSQHARIVGLSQIILQRENKYASVGVWHRSAYR